MKACLALVLGVAVALSACTRKREVPKGPDGKPMITAYSEPERLVLETEISVPAPMQKNLKRTDLMIWDLRDAEGNLLAGNIQPVPKFPHKISVSGKQLRKEIPQTAPLLFNARIVRFGEEHKPPQKGQLAVTLGGSLGAAEVVNPHVNQKQLDAWMKKNNLTPLQELTVGAKVKAEFGPVVF